MADRTLRLLSLDGGGVRGLSSLYILLHLMRQINPDEPPKPCDVFDMIAGTSTGGLIALMLGRLHMSVADCIEAYSSLSNDVFRKVSHRINIQGKVQARFDATVLESYIKMIVLQQGLEEDAPLLEGSRAKCRVLVCATRAENRSITHLTSYATSRGANDPSITICEAARATSAASSFFSPVVIGKHREEYVDGATGANNPVRELWTAAQDIWDDGGILADRIKMLVSIGTGVPSLEGFGQSIVDVGKTLLALATETENTAETFSREHRDMARDKRYFRFSVDRGLENVGLEESVKTAIVVSATRRYLETQAVYEYVLLFKDRFRQDVATTDRPQMQAEGSLSGNKLELYPEKELQELESLAEKHFHAGWFPQAQKEYRQLVDDTTRIMGQDHPKTTSAKRCLGNAYYYSNEKWAEAADIYEEVCRESKATLGRDHPDTLEDQYKLGVAYCWCKRWEEGKNLFSEVVETRKTVLGINHPDTLHAMESLVAAQIELGNISNGLQNMGEYCKAKFRNFLAGMD